MKIYLVDDINNINEFYEVDNNINYYNLWDKIDEIVENHNYSCISFPIPEINKAERKIKIKWIELFGDLSESYIEITEVPELIFDGFDWEIKRANLRNKVKNSN